MTNNWTRINQILKQLLRRALSKRVGNQLEHLGVSLGSRGSILKRLDRLLPACKSALRSCLLLHSHLLDGDVLVVAHLTQDENLLAVVAVRHVFGMPCNHFIPRTLVALRQVGRLQTVISVGKDSICGVRRRARSATRRHAMIAVDDGIGNTSRTFGQKEKAWNILYNSVVSNLPGAELVKALNKLG